MSDGKSMISARLCNTTEAVLGSSGGRRAAREIEKEPLATREIADFEPCFGQSQAFCRVAGLKCGGALEQRKRVIVSAACGFEKTREVPPSAILWSKPPCDAISVRSRVPLFPRMLEQRDSAGQGGVVRPPSRSVQSLADRLASGTWQPVGAEYGQ